MYETCTCAPTPANRDVIATENSGSTNQLVATAVTTTDILHNANKLADKLNTIISGRIDENKEPTASPTCLMETMYLNRDSAVELLHKLEFMLSIIGG